MLAEIFFLRLEATARASADVDRARNSRFVALPQDAFYDLQDRQPGEPRKKQLS
jgi:hypothetical protein